MRQARTFGLWPGALTSANALEESNTMSLTISPPEVDGAQEPTPASLRRRERSPLRQRLSRLDVKASPYLYIAPFFILFGLIGLFPLVYTFVVSLFDWHLLKGQGDFVGIDNFVAVLQDRFFWNSLFNTFSIFLLSSIPQLVAAIVIAAVLDQNIRAKTFWRMSVLLPYIVTPVAVSLIFTNMFNEQYGLINNILGSFGLDPVMWKTETLPSHIAIATMVNWRWTGYNALILLAAMQSVPRDIHESAAIDGAGAIRRFFSMTVPSIRPTMIFVIITGLGMAFATIGVIHAVFAHLAFPAREIINAPLHTFYAQGFAAAFKACHGVGGATDIAMLGVHGFIPLKEITGGLLPEQIAAMFDQVSTYYDRTNAVLSMGQAALWRTATTKEIGRAHV